MQESFNCGGKKRDEDMRKTAKLVTNFSPLHVERNEILDVIVNMGYFFKVQTHFSPKIFAPSSLRNHEYPQTRNHKN